MFTRMPGPVAVNSLLCKFSDYVLGDVSVVTFSMYLFVVCLSVFCLCLPEWQIITVLHVCVRRPFIYIHRNSNYHVHRTLLSC